jgi:hypothetical protein
MNEDALRMVLGCCYRVGAGHLGHLGHGSGDLGRLLPQTTCALRRKVRRISAAVATSREGPPSGSGLAPPPTDAQVIAGTILGIAGMAIDASIHRRHW